MKKFTIKYLFFSLLALGMFGCAAAAPLAGPQDPPADRVAYRLFNDFETGELYGWEPYPYAEDTGFEAFFAAHKEPTYQGSKYALARPVRAHNTTELYQGFTKRLNLWTTDQTRLQTAVYFQADRRPATLRVTLGTFDGATYTHTIRNPQANQWLELDLPRGAFTSAAGDPLTTGRHIQVVALKGSYPIIGYLNTYTILMDNFRLNGERQRRFVATQPSSTTLEMFGESILNKHFFYGDTIGLSVRPEDGAGLQEVRGQLIDSGGNIVKDNIRFRPSGDTWSNDGIYQLAQGDDRGRWTLKLTGQTAGAPPLRWSFRFLMPGEPVDRHPRLFFSDQELRRRMANDSPTAQRILEKALEDTEFMEVDIDAIKEGPDRTAENLTGGPFDPYSNGFGAYGDWRGPIARLGQVIEDGSLYYAFTGDREAGQQAKQALLKLCSFDKWNAAWMFEQKFWTYYPVGYTIKPVAYGYDMLYDLLSDQERARVRTAIIEKGLKLFHRDMVQMNRMPSNMTNHIAVLLAGHGLAATAIYGDDPDNPSLEPYLSGIMTKAETFIDRTYYPDGSYGEPKSGYMNMASRDLVEIVATFERNFGVDWSTTTDMRNFYKYPLYATHPSGLMPDFGDGHNHFDAFTELHSQWFVHRTGNRYLYKYVKPYWEAGNGGFLGYLWYRDDLKPASRKQLQTSKVFDDAQGMVMRSGWADTSSIISLKVGPHSNHYHFDQGTFQIMTNGNTLLTDPGIGQGGYYANLDYQAYNVEAIAHNVMLVDYDPESQTHADFDNGIAALSDWPRMQSAFAGELADAVTSDLATVYKGKLDRYARTLLYTKTGPLFLFDQVESAPRDPHTVQWLKNRFEQTPPPLAGEDGHVFNWMFHAQMNEGGQRSLSYDADRQRMSIDRTEARLTMDVVAPSIASSRIRDMPNESEPESYLMLNSRPNQQDIQFLAVLLPEAKPAGPRPTISRLQAPGWLGARVQRSDGTDFGLFRTNDGAAGGIEGFTTDARRFTATLDAGGGLQKAYFEGHRFSGHGLRIQAEAPLTCAVSPGDGQTRLELKAAQPTRLSISLPRKPSSVSINGETISNWNYDSGDEDLSIKVPEGRNNISIQ